MWCEKYYDGPAKDSMSDLPSTMYWTSIFIIGEWADVDFSFGAGSRMCIFYCLIAVCVFAIPVGIISESVSDSIQRIIEERAEVARLFGIGNKDAAYTKGQDANLGAPMIPGSAGSSGPLADPIYMPRSANQERAMLVPRPPGALAPRPAPQQFGGQMPPGSTMPFGGNPMLGDGKGGGRPPYPGTFQQPGPSSFQQQGPGSFQQGKGSFQQGPGSFQQGKPGMNQMMPQGPAPGIFVTPPPQAVGMMQQQPGGKGYGPPPQQGQLNPRAPYR